MNGLPRFRDVLANGIIGLVAGGLISLITLIPDSTIAPQDRLYLGFVVLIIFIAGVSYQYLRRLFIELRENASLARNYLNLIPKTVRFEEYKRELTISTDGDGTVHDRYRIKNIGDNTIGTLSIPQFCDIYEDLEVLFDYTGDEPRIQFEEPDAFVELNEMKINSDSILNPGRAYNRRGYLIGEDLFQERGQHKISFNSIGELQSENDLGNSSVEVEMNYTARGGVSNALDGGADYIACDSYHPTDSMELVIYPPDNHEIVLHETDENPEAIDVLDIHGKIHDLDEKSSVSKPREVRGDKIEWEIVNPKINYRYKVYFRCEPETAT